MHSNVLVLRWECRKRREQDKEAKVSQAKQRCRYLVFLSYSKHPTLLAPLAALGGQTKRFVRKVTKINKSETPPPTTWPKACGFHTRCYSSFPSQLLPSYASLSRAGRRRPGGHTGGLRSSWAPPIVLPVGWLCCSGVGAGGQRPQSSWPLLPPPVLRTVHFEVFKVSKSFFFKNFVFICGGKRPLLLGIFSNSTFP